MLPKILKAKVIDKNGRGYSKTLELTLDNGEIELIKTSETLKQAKEDAKEAVGKTLGYKAFYYEGEIEAYKKIGSTLTESQAINEVYFEELERLDELQTQLKRAYKNTGQC